MRSALRPAAAVLVCHVAMPTPPAPPLTPPMWVKCEASSSAEIEAEAAAAAAEAAAAAAAAGPEAGGGGGGGGGGRRFDTQWLLGCVHMVLSDVMALPAGHYLLRRTAADPQLRVWQATREVEAAGGDGDEEEEESARARQRRAYAMHAGQKAAGETDDSAATGFHHIFPRPTAANPAGIWVDGNGREKIPFTFHPRPAADMAAAAGASSLQSVLALAQGARARRRGRGRGRGWAWARARAWAWPRWRRRRARRRPRRPRRRGRGRRRRRQAEEANAAEAAGEAVVERRSAPGEPGAGE